MDRDGEMKRLKITSTGLPMTTFISDAETGERLECVTVVDVHIDHRDVRATLEVMDVSLDLEVAVTDEDHATIMQSERKIRKLTTRTVKAVGVRP